MQAAPIPAEPRIPGPGPRVPDAAVVIPHFNDASRLGRCLAALMPQLPSGGADTLSPLVEVLVIDNGSRDDLSGLVGCWPGLRLVQEGRQGAAFARNRGVAETTAPLLIFLDCDCVPAPDWLARALQPRGSADLTGGAVQVFHESPGPLNGAQAFEAVFAFDNRHYIEKKGFSVTANLLTRRDVFAAVGPFRPGLSEDLDWCRRARAAGYQLAYAPDLVVGHPSRGDWTALRRKWLRLTQESYALQGPPGVRARLGWALRALAMPPSILAHAPKILRAATQVRLAPPAMSPPVSPAVASAMASEMPILAEGPRGLSGAEKSAALLTLARLRLLRMVWMLRQAAGGRP